MTSTDPRISVYIAAYQAEQYIGEAIQSCLGQTLPPAEIIVVDDASTDRTVEIARAIRDARVVVDVLPVNSGPGAARNRALEIATGSWLAVMDADDYMQPQRLEALWAAASKGRHRILIDGSRRTTKPQEKHWAPTTVDRPGLHQIGPATFLRQNAGGKPFFDSGLLSETGVRYPEQRAGQDTAFLVELSARSSESIAVVKEAFYEYRSVPGSLSERSNRRLNELDKMLDQLAQRLSHDTDILKAIANAQANVDRDRRMLQLKASLRARDVRLLCATLLDLETMRVVFERLWIKVAKKTRTQRDKAVRALIHLQDQVRRSNLRQ